MSFSPSTAAFKCLQDKTTLYIQLLEPQCLHELLNQTNKQTKQASLANHEKSGLSYSVGLEKKIKTLSIRIFCVAIF